MKNLLTRKSVTVFWLAADAVAGWIVYSKIKQQEAELVEVGNLTAETIKASHDKHENTIRAITEIQRTQATVLEALAEQYDTLRTELVNQQQYMRLPGGDLAPKPQDDEIPPEALDRIRQTVAHVAAQEPNKVWEQWVGAHKDEGASDD